MVCSEAPEHNADHGETDEGSNGGGANPGRHAGPLVERRRSGARLSIGNRSTGRKKSRFSTSRTFTERRRPPRLAGGIIGSTISHSASLRSLG
jgi:hypothetical protein